MRSLSQMLPDKRNNGLRTPGGGLCLPGVILITILGGCAVPIAPIGGPPDTDPPRMLESVPSNGQVSVDTQSMTIRFDERIDPRSLARAVTFTPEFAIQPEVTAGGNEIRIKFTEALRENTTYLVSIDTKLKDQHNVSLTSPITIAFGTGPSINMGAIRGHVRDVEKGASPGGVDILAFAAIDSTVRNPAGLRPDYRTQTDQNGQFRFQNLREQPYFVLAVRDANGNRMWDTGEDAGVPPSERIQADSTGKAQLRPWVLTSRDTTPPSLRRVYSRNTREAVLRFSEAVVLSSTDPPDWSLVDSTSGNVIAIRRVYAGDDPRDIVVRSDSLNPSRYRIVLSGAVSDSTGNEILPDTVFFSPSEQKLTASATFLSFLPDSLSMNASGESFIWPRSRPGIRFSRPPVADDYPFEVLDSLGAELPLKWYSRDGVRLYFDTDALPGSFHISVTAADTLLERNFVVVADSRLGDLGVVIEPRTGVQAELYREPEADTPTMSVPVAPEGETWFRGLPTRSRYRVRAFIDTNGDGRWNSGTVYPYRKSEQIGWLDVREPVRARWETVAADTLRIEPTANEE